MKKIIILIFCVLITGCTTTQISQPEVSNEQIDQSAHWNIWGYDFVKTFAKDSVSFWELNQENKKIELNSQEGVKEEFADQIIAEKITLFNSLFEITRTGYPGQYTKYIECPKDLKPQFFEKDLENGYLKYFVGFANANYNPGACAKDLIKYRLIQGFLFCRNENIMMEVNYYEDVDQLEEYQIFIDKINCQLD